MCTDILYTKHKILPRTASCNGVWTVLGTYPCSDPRARKCTQSPQMVPSKEASIHRHIQRSGLLRHLRPPLPRVLLIPRGRVWTGRARETARGQRATPYGAEGPGVQLTVEIFKNGFGPHLASAKELLGATRTHCLEAEKGARSRASRGIACAMCVPPLPCCAWVKATGSPPSCPCCVPN